MNKRTNLKELLEETGFNIRREHGWTAIYTGNNCSFVFFSEPNDQQCEAFFFGLYQTMACHTDYFINGVNKDFWPGCEVKYFATNPDDPEQEYVQCKRDDPKLVLISLYVSGEDGLEEIIDVDPVKLGLGDAERRIIRLMLKHQKRNQDEKPNEKK
jgi:hypothetical protein